MHARLLNWARVYAGDPLAPLRPHGERDEVGTTDELDAQVIEHALVVMRAWRPSYYRVVELAYLKRYQVPTCCSALRCSESDWYARLHRVYSWLHGRLAASEAPKGLISLERIG